MIKMKLEAKVTAKNSDDVVSINIDTIKFY